MNVLQHSVVPTTSNCPYSFGKMEIQHRSSWGFWSSSSQRILFLLLVAINFSLHHVSAANQFQNETDRLALLEFMHQISDDPYGVLNSWNHSLHHCHWQGVTCSTRHQGRVIALTLSGKSLSGTMSPHIGNLSFLNFINLGANQFHGEIPQEVGRLFRLTFLNLSRNALSGEIPVNLTDCSEIRRVSLSRNKLEGKIPIQLLNLKMLEILYLHDNNLTGEIPSFVANLSSLTELSLKNNNLEGNLPEEIGLLTSLTKLGVGVNKLSGLIPASVYNISAMVIISLTQNSFIGNLPTNIGLTLPNLNVLEYGGNKFYGKIPVSITNASRIEILDLPDNKLEGQVPINLGSLSNLQSLNLAGNLLGSGSTGDLGFIASFTNNSNLKIVGLNENNFGGQIPKLMANLSYQLTLVRIGENQLSGTIPEGLGSLVNLYEFVVAGNFLSGVIPHDFGKLQKLQYLRLGANKFSGDIFSTLSNMSSLYLLDLASNRFEGNLSGILGNCQNLQTLDLSKNNLTGIIFPEFFSNHLSLIYLDLAYNSFSGSLPLEVGKLIQLVDFNVSNNNFSGEIPPSLVDCSNLEHLHMQVNFFRGSIPQNFASLKSIQQLDFSSNNLTGQIPRNLEKLRFLNYVNLSYNNLEGDIPTAGIFGNANQISLVGNTKLCGGIPEFHLPSCMVVKGKNKGKLKVIVALSTGLSLIVLVIGTCAYYCLLYRKRDKRKADFFVVPLRVDKVLRVSYNELHRATSGFSPQNVIGSGGFGVVYKGRLAKHGDKLVAIKVLDLQKNGSSKSFKAECKALRNIRHRNLVSILCYCSSIDSKGHEFKALIYEFMENGNLDSWLHPETADETTRLRSLNLSQRLNIAIDAASALHYLHNHCEPTVVHCDLKPSNILIDNNLVAHVGDFGLARLLWKTTTNFSEGGTSSSIVLKGSIGYAAPEYGMGHAASTQGDVYSYGILLLEMITRRRPTDDVFADGLDLHNHVNMALPEQLFKIVDPLLLATGVENTEMAAEEDRREKECLISLLKIGHKCSARLPNDRMHMGEVLRKLHLIKDVFLGVRVHQDNLEV